MKKKSVLVLLATVTAIGMSACGAKELTLTTNQVEVELGSELDTAVTNYVADADVAAQATIDFSAVDMNKVGTYSAVVTYKEQTAGFDVIVTDTTAPIVDAKEQVVVAAGEPLYAEDVITSITELSGEVEVAFSEPETPADETAAVEGAEEVEDTETAEPTEETESTETAETTETVEETEIAEESTEVEEPETEFVLNNVICSNASVIYAETGEYDNTLTVTDASGNSTDVTVHIVVGDAPEFSGIGDMTVTVGTDADEIDFLDGVTAKDSNGNDITANIVCDSATVDLETAGEYTITYTVTDENGFTATQTATVTVEEKNSKDTKKNDSKTSDSKTDSSKKNNGGSSNSSSNSTSNSSTNNSSASSNGTSGGNNVSSGNSNSASGNSGNNSNSGNSNQASGGSSASGDSGNSGNTSTPSTPSTDNGGSTSTPSTPSTDTGSSDLEQQMQDQLSDFEEFDPSSNPSRDDELGGTGWTGDGWD